MNYDQYRKSKYAVFIFIVIAAFSYHTAVFSKSDMPVWTDQFKLVKGMAIYIGIVPAEMLEGHNASKMHGGVPKGNIRFHLSVAIFNEKTGERLNNAQIKAQIFTVPEKTGFKELEPMEYGKALLYGNYFSLNALGPYLIQLHIEHKKLPKAIDVEFHYQTAYAQLPPTSKRDTTTDTENSRYTLDGHMHNYRR